MKGNIFSPEDKEFMDLVQYDLRRYLQKNIFPSRTVLVFPPFNGFRRFLIHKLIEDNFASSEIAAFSIGQDICRRIVICYKGLISDAASKGLPATIPQLPKQNMIDKEKSNRQRQTPTAAVYRPPAARQANNRRSSDTSKPLDSKNARVRRPDQQMYVPRPKRASYGNDLPRSRSRSNSRLSLDSNQSIDVVNSEESRDTQPNWFTKDRQDESNLQSASVLGPKDNKLDTVPASKSDISNPEEEKTITTNKSEELFKQKNDKATPEVNVNESNENESGMIVETVTISISTSCESEDKKDGDMQVDTQNDKHLVENVKTESDKDEETVAINNKDAIPKETLETISLLSESRSEDSSSSSSFMSFSDSNTSNSPIDSESEKTSKHKSSEKMDTDHAEGNILERRNSRSKQKEEKTKKIEPSTTEITEVLVISDSSSCDEILKTATDECKQNKTSKKSKSELSKKAEVQVKSCAKQSKNIDLNECDWESLYDDSGECLVPSLMEELAKSVGKVRVTSADSDYRPYQSIEERSNDGECVIEIYDFPAEFKTTDLFNVFAAYSNKNFQIKWVDDTHALGIFPSPLMADDVLASTLPFVKTRPLRLGIAESRMKARNLILPPLPSAERPKTCSALAKRLVSGALGLRIPLSSQEREKEKQVLKEAREKRRLEAKQREAAWNGTITSGSAI